MVDFGGILRPQGQLDPYNALQPYRGPMTQRTAAHLLRRAGFGGSPQEIERYASMPVDAAVESLVRFPATNMLPGPSNVFSPVEAFANAGGAQGLREMSDTERKGLEKSLRMQMQKSTFSTQLWWLNRMLSTPAPLQEKMTLLFHGHFTSAVGLKNIWTFMIYNQNELFRSYALGNFRELTRAVSIDPAMLRYLDGTSNVKGQPNENFARELMELFTLGLNNYTEDDIRESARAWTGWRFNLMTLRATYQPRFHDDGVKTFLGRTGNFDGNDIVNIIFEQPQCSRYIAAWLLNNFVYNNPEEPLIDGVARLLQRNNFELAPVMSAILSSNVFYSDRAYRSLVKSPVEFVVGTYKALGLTSLPIEVLPPLTRMGQILFYPPNVAGWPGGENWLTSASIIERQNFLARTINSQTIADSSWLRNLPQQPKQASRALVSAILQGDAAPASMFELEGYLGGSGTSALMALSGENYDERISGAAYMAMATPAYQLG